MRNEIQVARSIWFPALLRWALVLAVLIVPHAGRALDWHATVGAQSGDKGHQALAFLPNEIWIHAGDSITSRFDADDVHTVTLLTATQPRPDFFVAALKGFGLVVPFLLVPFLIFLGIIRRLSRKRFWMP